MLREKKLKETCEIIGDAIDKIIQHRKRKFMPHKYVGIFVPIIFPGAKRIGKGAFKTVFVVRINKEKRALKFSNPKDIQKELNIYDLLTKSNKRRAHRYFAKIYWATKYFTLQKYGTISLEKKHGKKSISAKKVKMKLRKAANSILLKYNKELTDIRPANIMKVGRTWKIVDASLKKK